MQEGGMFDVCQHTDSKREGFAAAVASDLLSAWLEILTTTDLAFLTAGGPGCLALRPSGLGWQ